MEDIFGAPAATATHEDKDERPSAVAGSSKVWAQQTLEEVSQTPETGVQVHVLEAFHAINRADKRKISAGESGKIEKIHDFGSAAGRVLIRFDGRDKGDWVRSADFTKIEISRAGAFTSQFPKRERPSLDLVERLVQERLVDRGSNRCHLSKPTGACGTIANMLKSVHLQPGAACSSLAEAGACLRDPRCPCSACCVHRAEAPLDVGDVVGLLG